MATKLKIWNGALIDLGHRRLDDTGEPVVAGRTLTDRYDQVVEECLSVGSWNFAMETVKAVSDTGITPEFGFTEVFAKPTDWMHTIGVSEDEYFTLPLLHYYDDASFWSADASPIYIRYVSSDTGLGFELTRWPALFTRYVELELASRSCMKLTQSETLLDKVDEKRNKARTRALSKDAMNEAQPKFLPPGTWTSARGGGASRSDRGSRDRLTG